MKKIFFITVIFLAFQFYFNDTCTAQWQSDVRINNDTGASYTSFNNTRSIAVNGDTVIVFWQTQVNGWWSIYSKRSYNSGVTWLDSVEIRHTSVVHYTSPSACYSNNRFYVANIGHQTAINQYYVEINYSTDAGVTWNMRSVFTNDNFIKDKPTVTADSNYVHVACWVYISPSSYVIKYKRSTNSGITFGDETSWTSVSALPDNPSITSNGSNVMIAFQESSTGKYEIIFRRSTNYGLGWGGFETIATGSDYRGFPSIAASGSYIYIFWQDSKYGNSDIISRRSTDLGSSWINEVRLTSHSSNQNRPNVTANGTNVHAVWEDDRDSTEIYYLAGVNHGGTWQTVQRLTDNPYSSLKPSIAVSGQKLHVCWSDRRTGNYDVYYKRNPTGNAIGIKQISSEVPQNYFLSQNYPNPFNPLTKIKFDVRPSLNSIFGKEGTEVILKVFDVLGNEVATLVNEQLKPGTYEVEFDGANYSSGAYFYRLKVNYFVETKRMILVK